MPSTEDIQFGRLALAHNFVTHDELTKALEEQERQRLEEGVAPRLGEVLIAMGLMTEQQIQQLVDEQSGRHGGKTLGGYQLLERIGSGGMGAVYKARQASLNRIVALKVLPQRLARDKDFIARFYREARAVAKFSHPNIVSGFEVGEADGYHFLAMEYVDGNSAAELLARTPDGMPEDKLLKIALHVAEALQHAHESNIIHRDIKPENILIGTDGIAKLCDLGLARSAGNEDASLTQAGMAVGTPHYISPEQARGRQDIDPRADIYSFGATLFHLATGRPVFTGDNPLQIMTKHLEDPPPLAAEVCPSVSPELSAVIGKMLVKSRGDRYQFMADVIEDIQLVADGERPVHAEMGRIAAAPAGARPSPPRRRPATRKINTHVMRAAVARKRRPQQMAAVVLLSAVVLMGGGFFLWQSMRDRDSSSDNRKKGPRKITIITHRRDPAAEREARFKKLFEAAKTYALEHKGEYRAQIDRFEYVARKAGPKSLWGRRSARQAASALTELHEAIEKAFAPLRTRSKKLAATREYGKCITLFRDLPADFKYRQELKSRELADAEISKIEASGLAHWKRLLAASEELLGGSDFAGARKALKPAEDFGLPAVSALLSRQLASIRDAEGRFNRAAVAQARKTFGLFVSRFRAAISRRDYASARKDHQRTLAAMRKACRRLPADIADGMKLELADLATCEEVFNAVLGKFRNAKRGARFQLPSPFDGKPMSGSFDTFNEATAEVILSRRRAPNRVPFKLRSFPCMTILELAGLGWGSSKPAEVRKVVIFVCRDGKATPEDRKIVKTFAGSRKFDASRYFGTPDPVKSSGLEDQARQVLNGLRSHVKAGRWQQAADAADSLCSGAYDATETLKNHRAEINGLKRSASAKLATGKVEKLTLQYGAPLWKLGSGYYRGVVDTSIASGGQSAVSRGGARQIILGKGSARILIRFDLSTLPRGIKIRSAKLQLYCLQRRSGDIGKLRIYCLKRAWSAGQRTRGSGSSADGATWTHSSTGPAGRVAWSTPGGDLDATTDHGKGPGLLDEVDPPASGRWASLDVTPAVADIVRARKRNYGFLIATQKPDPGRVRMISSDALDQYTQYRPRLLIEAVDLRGVYAPPRTAEHAAETHRFTGTPDLDTFAENFIVRSGITGKRARRGMSYAKRGICLRHNSMPFAFESKTHKWTGNIELCAKVEMPAGGTVAVAFGKALPDSRASFLTLRSNPALKTTLGAASGQLTGARRIAGTLGVDASHSPSASLRTRYYMGDGRYDLRFVKEGLRLRLFTNRHCIAEMGLSPRDAATLAKLPVRLAIHPPAGEDDETPVIYLRSIYLGPVRPGSSGGGASD